MKRRIGYRRGVMILLAVFSIQSCAHQVKTDEAENLVPFDPAKPHEDMLRLAFSDGRYAACSIGYDAAGAIKEEREFRLSVVTKVFGLARSIDYILGKTGDRTVQSAFIARENKTGLIQELVQSPNGYLEYWDQIPSDDPKSLSLQMREKAKLMQDGDAAKSMLFRKTYQNIGADYFETVLTVSEDDGGVWRKLFHEYATRVTDHESDSPACPPQ